MKHKENFYHQPLDKVIADRFGRYSKYIIQDRALPDARDGLKPVQRRIIFAMHELGLIASKAYKKSARVVGEVIGKYHPHGDTSIYDALTRMSQSWKVNIPLIEMHGNNGSIDDDPPAAMRYTEVRLSKIANSLIYGIKKETVLFAPNFDDSEIEPTILPALLPNLLINGARGIAAGYATEIPPHNLGEVIDGIIAKVQDPSINLQTLFKIIRGPDFPTGGIIQGKNGIFEAFEHGKGRILIRSKYKIITKKNQSAIVITEIPYGIAKAKLVREIDEIRFNNKINGINDVRDESDRNGINIRIDLEANTNVQAVVNYLLAKTEMQIYYSYNMVAIQNKKPCQMGLMALIDAYLKHQTTVLKKALTFELKRAQKRLEIVDGFIRIATLADEAIKAIRQTKGNVQVIIKMLQEKFLFTRLQAETIAKLQLYRLSQTNQSDYQKEKMILQKNITKTSAILNSKVKFNNYLINLLQELKDQYITKRKTVVVKNIESVVVDLEALIKHERVWIGVTRQGYIKRFSKRVYETNNIRDYKIRAYDVVEYLQFISTKNKLIVFTNKGNYSFILVHKISETKFKEVGNHINDFTVFNENEFIIGVVAVSDFKTKGYITLVTAKGQGKRILIENFQTLRHSKTYKAIKMAKDDELRAITISNGWKYLVVISKNGFATKYLETQLSVKGLQTQGIKAIALASNDEVASIASGSNDEVLGIVSNRGGMKRIKMEAITTVSRTSKGKLLFKKNQSNPHIILDSRVVDAKTEVIFSKDILEDYKFSEVDITSPLIGLSLVGSNSNGALINNYETIASENSYFQSQNKESDAKRFEKAEASIAKASQISIDEILKNIK